MRSLFVHRQDIRNIDVMRRDEKQNQVGRMRRRRSVNREERSRRSGE